VFADNRNLSAEALRREQKGFFDGYAPKAHQVLNDIPEKYIDDGVAQFQIPEKLKAPPIFDRGTVMEIAALFGGAEKLRTAVSEMQRCCTPLKTCAKRLGSAATAATALKL